VHRTGGLVIAEPGSTAIESLEATAAATYVSGLPVELLAGVQVSELWPQWRLDGEHTAPFDPEAGSLDIRQATAAHLALWPWARGAAIRPEAPGPAITESPAATSPSRASATPPTGRCSQASYGPLV
jgi:sarcosine oxidase